MWDYLVRILRPEDVPRKAAEMEFPHAADGTGHIRTSTESAPSTGTGSIGQSPSPIRAPIRYCPVCHVRMGTIQWRGVEALHCPECEGLFLFRKSLDELAGAVFDQEAKSAEPIIYTPEGVLRSRRRNRR